MLCACYVKVLRTKGVFDELIAIQTGNGVDLSAGYNWTPNKPLKEAPISGTVDLEDPEFGLENSVSHKQPNDLIGAQAKGPTKLNRQVKDTSRLDMSGQFTFSFGRDDLADDDDDIGLGDDASEVGSGRAAGEKSAAQPVPSAPRPRSTAFPVPGQPQLSAMTHDLHEMLAQLPSKIAYGFVDIQGPTRLPRRELWDVKVQMMAEADLQTNPEDAGLGKCDVKTGVYEGGFKSWESSVDLVKVLLEKYSSGALFDERRPLNIVEVG